MIGKGAIINFTEISKRYKINPRWHNGMSIGELIRECRKGGIGILKAEVNINAW